MAGLLWELAKTAFLLFVSTYISISNLIYGSVAAMLAFLAWAYLSALILLFGAYLSVSYYRLKQQQREESGQNTSGKQMKQTADSSKSNVELLEE